MLVKQQPYCARRSLTALAQVLVHPAQLSLLGSPSRDAHMPVPSATSTESAGQPLSLLVGSTVGVAAGVSGGVRAAVGSSDGDGVSRVGSTEGTGDDGAGDDGASVICLPVQGSATLHCRKTVSNFVAAVASRASRAREKQQPYLARWPASPLAR